MNDCPPNTYYIGRQSIRPQEQFCYYPYCVTLLPAGMVLDDLCNEHVGAFYLIDVGRGIDVLNGEAIDVYLKARVPVLLIAKRWRDLKPFQHRAKAFKARGYAVTEIPGEASNKRMRTKRGAAQ